MDEYVRQPDVPGHPEPRTMAWSELERRALHRYGLECYEAGLREQRRIEQQASHRNWMLLAFRALNDADGALYTVETESTGEEWLLIELRERVKALAIQVPTLLGMGYTATKHAAEEMQAPNYPHVRTETARGNDDR